MPAVIALVLALQLAGELASRTLGLPVPGPVIGLLLLFVVLVLRGETPEPLAALANGLLSHLSLLFVPAGVGVMSYLALLADAWLAVLITVIASTLLAIAATAGSLRLLQRLSGRPDDHG